jgi:hypothetical protein
MFPGGDSPTVGLGGYLLQEGFGWNSRLYGMGCEKYLRLTWFSQMERWSTPRKRSTPTYTGQHEAQDTGSSASLPDFAFGAIRYQGPS